MGIYSLHRRGDVKYWRSNGEPVSETEQKVATWFLITLVLLIAAFMIGRIVLYCVRKIRIHWSNRKPAGETHMEWPSEPSTRYRQKINDRLNRFKKQPASELPLTEMDVCVLKDAM
jgi:hypothetical protein